MRKTAADNSTGEFSIPVVNDVANMFSANHLE